MGRVRDRVPPSTKKRLRRLQHGAWRLARRPSRYLVLRRALADLQEVAPDAAPDRSLIDRLVDGWDNPYGAAPEYLDAVVRTVRAAGSPVLECGSGLTTIVLGHYAEVWTLENEPAWARRVTRYLQRCKLGRVHLHTRPLVDHEGLRWYPVPDDLPPRFPVVVCDGPPGGRVALLAVLGSRLRGASIVVDAGMIAEATEVAAWQADHGVELVEESPSFLVLRVP